MTGLFVVALALLDDARIAATDELTRRGLHVITRRPRFRKVA